MRKSVFAITLVVLLALPAGRAFGQAKASEPKAASGPSAELLAAWNDVGRKLIEMAEDFPEDKYNFKPQPEVRGFAEQLLHVAGADYLFMSAVKGTKMGPGTGENPPLSAYKTKADVVNFLKKAVGDGAELIKEQGDAGLSKAVKFPFGDRMMRASSIWYDAIEHSGEHYGQLVVYYRVNGMVPPESRPRSR